VDQCIGQIGYVSVVKLTYDAIRTEVNGVHTHLGGVEKTQFRSRQLWIFGSRVSLKLTVMTCRLRDPA
jgi:hypothetical protein